MIYSGDAPFWSETLDYYWEGETGWRHWESGQLTWWWSATTGNQLQPLGMSFATKVLLVLAAGVQRHLASVTPHRHRHCRWSHTHTHTMSVRAVCTLVWSLQQSHQHKEMVNYVWFASFSLKKKKKSVLNNGRTNSNVLEYLNAVIAQITSLAALFTLWFDLELQY